MDELVPDLGKRGEEIEKLVEKFRNANLIEILQKKYDKDNSVIIAMIKASVNHKADYLTEALKEFIAE